MQFEVISAEDMSVQDMEQVILNEADFDYIREKISQLKEVNEKYGPFVEIPFEETESNEVGKTTLTRRYHDKRGWICDDLSKLDESKIWTEFDDFNEEFYMISGYEHDKPDKIMSWYISDKPNKGGSKDQFFTTKIRFFVIDSETQEAVWEPDLYLFNLLELQDPSNSQIISNFQW
jgi:hypothetical protein